MKQAITFVVLALVVGAMAVHFFRLTTKISSANVVETTSGTVTSLVTDSGGPSPFRMAVVQLMDGSVVKASILPSCDVSLGEVANLSIIQVSDSKSKIYVVTGPSEGEI